jgi:preprotein translocase subunit SecY
MIDLAATLASPDNRRRLLVTAGALFLYRLGCQIPVPGLDPQALLHLGDGDGTALQRLSIFAIGVTPIFSVALIVELARLTIPGLGQRLIAEPGRTGRWRNYMLIAALVVAAIQAIGIARALEAISGLVDEPGLAFEAGIVVTFVGATAFLGWLGERITLHGLGNGFWLLLVAPFLSAVPRAIRGSSALWHQGAIDSVALCAAVGFLALTVVLVVAASGARARPGTRRISPIDIASRGVGAGRDEYACVWAPLLASYFGGFLIFGLALIFGHAKDAVTSPWLAFGGPGHLFVVAALIAGFTYLRIRSARKDPVVDGGASDGDISRPAWIMGIAQIIICAGAELLTRALRLPFALDGAWLIVVCTVAMNFIASFDIETRPSRRPSGASGAGASGSPLSRG